MTFPDARIALCKCKEGRKEFGVRFEAYENEWKATWAFEIKKKGAEKREHYDETVLKGHIRIEEKYPGCPYCGSKAFVICSCGGLNCNNHEPGLFTCMWCGKTGELEAYDGGGFNSSGDR